MPWPHRVSAVISGWKEVAIRLPSFTATIIFSTAICAAFSAGNTYSASTSTAGPADRMAGARMKMARNGPFSSPGILHGNEVSNQGLTLVHFSAQPKPFLVTEATASVHFSAQPETFLPMRPVDTTHIKCSRQAEEWTSVVHKKRFLR